MFPNQMTSISPCGANSDQPQGPRPSVAVGHFIFFSNKYFDDAPRFKHEISMKIKDTGTENHLMLFTTPSPQPESFKT